MRNNFRIVAVTPAGRRRYIEILYKYIARDRNLIDEWQLWLNTTDAADIDYCNSLAAKNPAYIKALPLQWKWKGNFSIYPFFRNCIDSNTIYIRFDDDIVWVEDGAIEKLIDFRIANPEYFLVFPNIINNSIVSHIHQRMGSLPLTHGICDYSVLDPNGWKSPEVASMIHDTFLAHHKNPNKYKFDRWLLYFYERFSINSFAFFGDTFAKFHGAVGEDEENWLLSHKPKQLKMMNCVCGESLMVHFAYHTQRKHLEKLNYLNRYQELSKKLL